MHICEDGMLRETSPSGAIPMKKQYHVDLTSEERNHLVHLLKGGTRRVREIKRAQVLLKADDGRTDQ